MNTIVVPQGEFEMEQYPATSNNSLQAWDAADQYLLSYIHELELSAESKILIFNDRYGILACALANYKLNIVTDSIQSKQGIENNLKRNKIDQTNISILDSLRPLESDFDLIIFKIPKTLSFLEYQLQSIANFPTENIPVIGAAMVRNIHTSTVNLFSDYLIETKTSLARKKARLILAKTGNKHPKFTTKFPIEFKIEKNNYRIVNHANVFSGKKLDIGTRFFIENIPDFVNPAKIVDLGCGNGVLALHAAALYPEAQIICTDESYMAIASARETMQINGFESAEKYQYLVCDNLMQLAEDSIDLILCNPPFHQQHSLSWEVAVGMFREANRVLAPDGEFWVVANRHLRYHISLKKFFTNVETAASNSKFVILRASGKIQLN